MYASPGRQNYFSIRSYQSNGLFRQNFKRTGTVNGTGTRRFGLLYIMWKFSHCGGNGNCTHSLGIGQIVNQAVFAPFLVTRKVILSESLCVLFLVPLPLSVWKLRHKIVPGPIPAHFILIICCLKSLSERCVLFISEVVQEIVCQVVNRVQPPKSVRISDVSLALKISPERIKRPI